MRNGRQPGRAPSAECRAPWCKKRVFSGGVGPRPTSNWCKSENYHWRLEKSTDRSGDPVYRNRA